ncbi:dipeptidyl-peptidase-4 [Spirosomataceae bacterium TFI 002]|nr:dipeptidyl-peptidase-4 [Spirosomataceae bacterium TFI 002]
MKLNRFVAIITLLTVFTFSSFAQPGYGTKWSKEGNATYYLEKGNIVQFDIPSQSVKIVLEGTSIAPANSTTVLEIEDFTFTEDYTKLILFTNGQKVWRYKTRGDFWVYDLKTKALKQLGKSLPATSLMFAKLSPDASMAAYVSNRNIYLENLSTGEIKPLTNSDGKPRLINGTFDWAYEEEFSCYDGFRWSPDSKCIAYWQVDATDIKNFYMINNTDNIYSEPIPIEYPKVGEAPSAVRIGVIDVNTTKTTWIDVPGDQKQHYIPRMEWTSEKNTIILQQLNRKQNTSKLFYGNAKSGKATLFHEESDPAWVDVRTTWHDTNPAGWEWINGGKEFLWVSEKDGWNHVYKVTANGKNEVLVTDGAYDVIKPLVYVPASDLLYFIASPESSTESYLYSISVMKKGVAQKVSPANQVGSHSYDISPNGMYAEHSFQNYYTRRSKEWVKLGDHSSLSTDGGVSSKISADAKANSNVSFFEVTTEDGVTMQGWIAKPDNFDPSKKYATVFYVYAEPAGQTSRNTYGAGKNGLYNGNMAADGYIYISVDGRGSPAPKGREWRKSIYKNIGIINIRDQAMACKKIIEKYPYVDADRIAVHGWSGGGSTTLNLLFQYPDLYQTGISVAAVGNQLSYDNIYQERYMGVPPGDLDGFVDGSPITHAKNLKGNLLYIHGTGDDNVHYQNAEMLVNELIKHNKQFQFMPYPNRSHGIYEGEGTRRHLNTLFTNYLKQHCPPGPRDR